VYVSPPLWAVFCSCGSVNVSNYPIALSILCVLFSAINGCHDGTKWFPSNTTGLCQNWRSPKPNQVAYATCVRVVLARSYCGPEVCPSCTGRGVDSAERFTLFFATFRRSVRCSVRVISVCTNTFVCLVVFPPKAL